MPRVVVALLLSAMVLGGAMWWRSGGSADVRQVPPPNQNGATMEKFALRETQRHQPRWEMLADVAQVDPKRDITMIAGVHLTLFSAKHGQVQVTARQGVIQNQSKNIRVCGDVQLVVGQDFSLSTECLQWHAAEQVLEADTPVVVQRGNLLAEGRGFRGSLVADHFEIYEQVRARWREP